MGELTLASMRVRACLADSLAQRTGHDKLLLQVINPVETVRDLAVGLRDALGLERELSIQISDPEGFVAWPASPVQVLEGLSFLVLSSQALDYPAIGDSASSAANPCEVASSGYSIRRRNKRSSSHFFRLEETPLASQSESRHQHKKIYFENPAEIEQVQNDENSSDSSEQAQQDAARVEEKIEQVGREFFAPRTLRKVGLSQGESLKKPDAQEQITYSKYRVLKEKQMPRVGSRIAFRRMVLEGWDPVLTSFEEGTVLTADEASGTIDLRLLSEDVLSVKRIDLREIRLLDDSETTSISSSTDRPSRSSAKRKSLSVLPPELQQALEKKKAELSASL